MLSESYKANNMLFRLLLYNSIIKTIEISTKKIVLNSLIPYYAYF